MYEAAIFLLILGADSRTIAHESTLLQIDDYDRDTILTDSVVYLHSGYQPDWVVLYE